MKILLLLGYLYLTSCMNYELNEVTHQESLQSDSFYSCPSFGNPKKNQEDGPRLTAKAVYGTDDRKDWFESNDKIKHQWARATTALIDSSKIQNLGNGVYRVESKTHGEKNNLCPEVPFRDQPSMALCSGFLAFYNDMVLTAGHCQRNTWDCKNTYFVFDFAKQREGQREYNIPASSIYRCKEIIIHEKEHEGDFTLVRLDRPVMDRNPLKFRRHGSVSVGEDLTLIGHPAGLPSKITEGVVREVNPPYNFFASIDASRGSSGSPVINTRTGLVEGVLVSGAKDYKSQGTCKVEYPCDPDNDQCTGELITPISRVLARIPQLCLL